MAKIIEVLKDPDNEHLVPHVWRSTLSRVVGAFSRGDFSLDSIEGVNPVSRDEADRFNRNIAAYGAHLAKLPERAWRTSVYRWMEGYWNVLVDLSTDQDEESDLVLFVRIDEQGKSYRFSVESVHVP